MMGAASWYRRPFAGVLVDPDGRVSSFGLPGWDGIRKGLRYPDTILSIDGDELRPPRDGRTYRATTWDRAVDAAARAGRDHVHVRVRTASGVRDLDLAITELDPLAFWVDGGGLIAIGALYVLAALIALGASPEGKLARAFAKTALFAACFLFTVFDYHTTRRLVPFFYMAFAMLPMCFFALPLRFPDDTAWLAKRPWIATVLDASGAALTVALVAVHAVGGETVMLRDVCAVILATSLFFFVVTVLVRFARAEGARRATMRALIVAMVPPHAVLGAAFVLGWLSVGGATVALCALPALALTPLSSVVAFIRHDLWGSRALLSRWFTRAVAVTLAGFLALTAGTALASALGYPFGGAFVAALFSSIATGALVSVGLPAVDMLVFPSRARYKPTVEQLSEELTLLTRPEDVAAAVERTVRRWLPCELIAIHLAGAPPIEGQAPLVSEAPGWAELSIDVVFHGSRRATLHLGKKHGGALFTSEDVDLLRTIVNQAALALAYADSYAELELRRRQQAEAWRGEREALVETVAAEIAHEVRYSINFFRSVFAETESGALEIEPEDVDIGREEVDRLERLVSGLRRVTSRRLERHSVSVRELVIKAERLLRDRLGERRVELSIDGIPSIRCDVDQTTQILVNLLSNAMDAAPSGTIGVSWSKPNGVGALVVWDSGPGFEGDPARLFAPWYTTKPRGTGLGLAITHRLVRAHGWTIEPARREGRTLFVIEIPASDISEPRAEVA